MATIQTPAIPKLPKVVMFSTPSRTLGDEHTYTVTDEDVLVIDCTSNSCVAHVPLAADSKGRSFTFVKSDPTSNCIGIMTVPVDGVELDSDLIGGRWPYMINKQHQSITIVSDGTDYQIASVN